MMRIRPRPAAAVVASVTLGLAAMLAAGCVERKVAAVTAPGSLRITELTASPESLSISEQSVLTATIDNPEGGRLSYNWQAYRGSVAGDGSQVRYFGSYCCAGTDWVVLTVTSDQGERHSKSVVLHVFTGDQ